MSFQFSYSKLIPDNDQNFYQSQPDSLGNWSWVESYPTDLETAEISDTTTKEALILRYRRSYNGPTNLGLHSIIVQSPYMKSALSKVLEEYPGVTLGADSIIFEAPFAPRESFRKRSLPSHGSDRPLISLTFSIN